MPNTRILDFNTSMGPDGAWEPRRHLTPAGVERAWPAASVRYGGSDVHELYQVDADGNIYQAETGNTDAGSAINITSATKRFALGAVSMLTQLYVRLEGVTDTVNAVVRCGGSEYGEKSQTYLISLSGTAGEDRELRQRLHRTLIGRWVQVELSGNVYNRPAIREIQLWYVPMRSGRVSA